jgi:hypothetical protein
MNMTKFDPDTSKPIIPQWEEWLKPLVGKRTDEEYALVRKSYLPWKEAIIEEIGHTAHDYPHVERQLKRSEDEERFIKAMNKLPNKGLLK